MGVSETTQSKMARRLNHLLLLLPAVILADGPGGHHHGAHHGDHHGAHGAHHGAHSADHGHGAAAHHADHGAAAHHPVQHTVVSSSPVQHHTVHSSGTVQQRPVSASFSIQPEAHPIQHSVSQGPQNLAQLIATHPKLTTLNAAVKAAGLEATLASPGPFTVFAPTNLAFEKIPSADLQRLLGDKAALSKILLRHVVPGTRMQGKNIPPGITNLKTAAGEQISASRDKFIQIKSKAGSAFIVLFDVIASNGVLHAVDTVF